MSPSACCRRSQGGSAREAGHRKLTGAIGSLPFGADHAADRGAVDDRAAPLQQHLAYLRLHAVHTPRTLILITWSNSSSSVSSRGALSVLMPALLKAASRRP